MQGEFFNEKDEKHHLRELMESYISIQNKITDSEHPKYFFL
jgi:hypothetical protein